MVFYTQFNHVYILITLHIYKHLYTVKNTAESSRSFTGSELNRETAMRKRDRFCLTKSFREARNEPWLFVTAQTIYNVI